LFKLYRFACTQAPLHAGTGWTVSRLVGKEQACEGKRQAS